MKVTQNDWGYFLKEYEKYLNIDGELQRRIKLCDDFEDRDVFFGGHPCLPGPGPYTRASIAYDPTNWAGSKGYKSTILDGKALIKIKVANAFACVIKLDNGKFRIVKKSKQNPCFSMEMTLNLFKNMIQGKHKVVWALCSKEAQVNVGKHQLGLSDWTTILIILACLSDMLEMDPEIWKFWENINTKEVTS